MTGRGSRLPDRRAVTSPGAGRFQDNWGRVPLIVYSCGILLPVIVALLRQELMFLLGVPAYAVLFWTGPFAAAAAVFWSRWSNGLRFAWILAAPFLSAAALGLVFFTSRLAGGL